MEPESFKSLTTPIQLEISSRSAPLDGAASFLNEEEVKRNETTLINRPGRARGNYVYVRLDLKLGYSLM